MKWSAVGRGFGSTGSRDRRVGDRDLRGNGMLRERPRTLVIIADLTLSAAAALGLEP